MKTVTINAVLNGWTVQCGCQTLVYTDADQLGEDLREYMHDPKAKEKAMIKSAMSRLLMDTPMTAETPQPPEPATNVQSGYPATGGN